MERKMKKEKNKTEKPNDQSRKKLILAAAEKQFLKKGFSGTSTRDIARSAGVSLGNLYNHFESKEKIFDALIELHSPTAEFEELVRFFETTEFPGNFTEVLRRLQNIVDRNMVFIRLTDIDGIEFDGVKTRKIIINTVGRVWLPVEKIIRAHGEQGLIRMVNPRLTLPLVIIALFAVFVVRNRFNAADLFGEQVIDDEVALQEISGLLLLGLLPRETN